MPRWSWCRSSRRPAAAGGDAVLERAALAAFSVLVLAALVAGPALAQGQLVIVTSLPAELVGAYAKAFAAATPGVEVVVKALRDRQGVTYLRDTRARPVADVFWAASVGALLTLKQEGLLEKVNVPQAAPARVPATIAGFPVHDADGFYYGFAVSGGGLLWNTRYLRAHGLAPPKEWTDLTLARYHNHLVMSAPSRSATTHLIVEVILQGYGWRQGWEILLVGGGNMGAISARASGALEAVVSGQYGIGVVVDSLGLSSIAAGQPVGFTYPGVTALVPASVAKVKHAPNGATADRFIAYLLSDEGQLLLFAPAIARLPVVPALYARAPEGYPNPFRLAPGRVTFDARRAASRANLVDALFDQLVTFRHAELKGAWKAINDASAAVAKARSEGRDVSESEALLRQARQLASQVPISAADADRSLNDAFVRRADVKARYEAEWDAFARDNYAKARALAAQATVR